MIKGEKRRAIHPTMKPQGAIPAFLLKLYEILENPTYHDVISWNQDENAFVVKRINEFSENVLPKYFKHNNFASFVRQLNMYDFHKSRQENNENEFYHRLFKRGQKHLLSEIKRKTIENHVQTSSQLVAVTRDPTLDKLKKEASQFGNEMETLKRHQNDIEKLTKAIYNQNSQLLKENKLLWNELMKNKDKYERKIEKLTYFICTVMQSNGNNQLGPSQTLKSLTNKEMSEALSELSGDTDISKNLFSDNGTAPLISDKKDNDIMGQNFSNYYPNKVPDTNFNSISVQNDLLSNQAPLAEQDLNLYNQQNLDPNLNNGFDPLRDDLQTKRKIYPKRRNLMPSQSSAMGPMIGEMPSKKMKTETEPFYNMQQNMFNAQEPINMMNNESTDDPLRNLSEFNLGLSRGPSYRDNDLGTLQAPALIGQKSSNEFPFISPLKDDFNDMYNMGEKRRDFEPPPKPEPQIGDLGLNFSPSVFANNTNQSAFSFDQSLDDSLYRN